MCKFTFKNVIKLQLLPTNGNFFAFFMFLFLDCSLLDPATALPMVLYSHHILIFRKAPDFGFAGYNYYSPLTKEFGRKKYLPSPLIIMYSSYWYLLTFSIAGSWIGNRTRNKTVQPTGNSTQNHILAVFESGFRNLLDPDSESIF